MRVPGIPSQGTDYLTTSHFLGADTNPEKRRIAPDGRKLISGMAMPAAKQQLRIFLGMMNFCQI